MANYLDLQERLKKLQVAVRPLNQSIVGTSVSFVHTALMAALTQGPLNATGVMVVATLAYPPFVYKLKAIEGFEILSQEEFARRPDATMSYQTYLNNIEKYIKAHEDNLASLKTVARVMDNYVQPAAALITAGIAIAAPLPNATAHILCAAALFVLPRVLPSDVRPEILAHRQQQMMGRH